MDSNQVFDIIEVISQLSSTKQKIQVLQKYGKDPTLQRVLRYALSPDTRFYITKYPKYKAGANNGPFNDTTYRILDLLSQRVLSGNRAVEVVAMHYHCLHPKSAKLFDRILRKDLRMGCSIKLVNRAIPNLIEQFDVMRPTDWQPQKMTYPCYGSVKYDGMRGVWLADRREFISRTGKTLHGLNSLTKLILRSPLRSLNLDGELLIPGLPSSVSRGRLMDHNSVDDAHFYIFDIYKGAGTLEQRLQKLRTSMGGMSPEGNVCYVTHFLCKSREKASTFYDLCIDRGFEGAVFKQISSYYHLGKTSQWMRKKVVTTFDLKVVDIFEGTGKYQNKLGGIVVEFRGQYVKVGTGFNDIQRTRFYDFPELIIGTTVEVACQEVTDDGSLRHPSFTGIRYDK